MLLIDDKDKVHHLNTHSKSSMDTTSDCILEHMEDLKWTVFRYVKYKTDWVQGNKQSEPLKKMMLNEMSHIQWHLQWVLQAIKGSKVCEEETSIYQQILANANK